MIKLSLVKRFCDTWKVTRTAAIRNLSQCQFDCPNCKEKTVAEFQDLSLRCVLCDYVQNAD